MEKEMLLKGLHRKRMDLIGEHDRLEKALHQDVKDMDCAHLASVSAELTSVRDRISLLNEIISDVCFE